MKVETSIPTESILTIMHCAVSGLATGLFGNEVRLQYSSVSKTISPY